MPPDVFMTSLNSVPVYGVNVDISTLTHLFKEIGPFVSVASNLRDTIKEIHRVTLDRFPNILVLFDGDGLTVIDIGRTYGQAQS